MSEDRKVPVAELKPGMYVTRLDRPWLESPFPFQGFRLETWDQVAEVQAACGHVYVEIADEAPDGEEPGERSREAVILSHKSPRRRRKGGQSRATILSRKEQRQGRDEPAPRGARILSLHTERRRRRGDARTEAKILSLVREREDDGDKPSDAEARSPEAVEWEARLARESGADLKPLPPKWVGLIEELRTARPLISDAHVLVNQQMHDARNGRSVDTVAARECVANITESVLRNPDALVWLSGLKSRDEYTYLHSLSVCILSIALGRFLGLPRETLRELGFGAFLHDIGKMRIPDNVLNKPGRLDDSEMAVMREHPALGLEIVDGSERIPESSRNVIFSHHERLDGSGYTEGVEGGHIHPLTQIVSVCDTYDALISHRPYKDARSALDATSVLYQARGRFFEPHLVHQFIRCIGIYPVGSLVELNTGEIGVVTVVNEERLRPRVLIMLDEKHHRLAAPREVDLSRTLETRSGRPLEISGSLEAGAFGLEPAELIDYAD